MIMILMFEKIIGEEKVSGMKNFISFIKEYATRDFIYFFAELSIEMFKKQMKLPIESLNCCLSFPLDIIQHGFLHRQVSVMLSAWDIHAMAYLSIKESTDYRKKMIQADEVSKVVNLYRGYENEHSGSEFLRDAELQDVYKYLAGITYEQFKFQNISWIMQNFNRNYHMLIGSDKIYREKIVSVDEITQKTFGLNADELLAVELIILWLCSQHADILSAPEELYRKKDETILTKENIQKILEYYTVTYDEVRESIIGKQIFYSKPFVLTDRKNEYIAISHYLVWMLIGDGLYWLVRDYYLKNDGGQRFVNTFGEMFEQYFEDIADIYLRKNAWNKIPEQKKKSADYFMEFEDAVFLFELKSGLLGIGAKQQNPSIQQIDRFSDRNIREAYQQLKNSEEEYQGEKPVIKIFLLYECMTNTQLIMSSIPEIFEIDSRCYIMTIEDLEMMLATYKNDYEKFRKVVNDMIDNQNNSAHFESVLKVLNTHGAIGNMHFIGERDYFSKIMKKLEIQLK